MAKLKNIPQYARATLSALRQRPSLSTLTYALKYAFECLTLFEARQPDFLAQAKPWICFPAARLLARVVRPNSRVFEYGSGGSTLYFAGRALDVVSVEHDSVWYERVQSELSARGISNVRYMLIEPVAKPRLGQNRVCDPGAYLSSDLQYSGHSFEAYARAIDGFPDAHFDLVVVDGRARPSCLMHAMAKVRTGGILLLDQSERSYYLAEMPELKDRKRWAMVRFMAPLPYSLHFTEATFFTKMRHD